MSEIDRTLNTQQCTKCEKKTFHTMHKVDKEDDRPIDTHFSHLGKLFGERKLREG